MGLSDEEKRQRACDRARAWRIANPERYRATKLAYRAAHAEEVRAYHARYRAEHLERKKASDRAWYQANLEHARQKNRDRYLRMPTSYHQQAARWAREHPEQEQQRVRAKNVRRRGAPMDAQAKDYIKILSADPCCYCGERTPKICIDHVVPLALGGTSEWSNLTAACRPCNAAQADKPLLAFLLRRLG